MEFKGVKEFDRVKEFKGIEVVRGLSGSTTSEVKEYNDLLKIFMICLRISRSLKELRRFRELKGVQGS